MKRLWRFLFHNPNRGRNRIQYVNPADRILTEGYLIQYYVIETDKGKVLPTPVVMAMVQPDKVKQHVTLPASDIQIV